MFVALLLIVSEPVDLVAEAHDCSYDLEAMLELDRIAFDQDLDGGWRLLFNRGCHVEAAELIREWRHEKRDHASILYTHEGQMRAYAGQDREAVALLRLTYKPSDQDVSGWNFYMDGTIAFLERNRKALLRAIERLKAVPSPNTRMVLADGSEAKIKWPLNLDVLEAFERCWERTYAEATAPEGECRRPADRTVG
ncbi:MAG: hypothetical protein QNJ15_03600 [Erythrobacter sp.]|nr:hypothetical protein [Erythrobacter sp.]